MTQASKRPSQDVRNFQFLWCFGGGTACVPGHELPRGELQRLQARDGNRLDSTTASSGLRAFCGMQMSWFPVVGFLRVGQYTQDKRGS